MRLPPNHRLIALAIIVLGACTDSTGLGDGPAILLSGAASATDTVGAVLPQALIVEVRDSSGAPAPAGTVVHFEYVQNSSDLGVVGVQVPDVGFFNSVADALTDDEGRVSVIIGLGGRPGTAHVAVTVPSLGVLEYATFTVTAGHAARTVLSPRDTLLYVGNSVAVHGTVVDREGNALADAVTYSSGPPSGISVSSTGVVTASAVGRYYVKATSAVGTDSVGVSVMPRGRFVGYAEGFRLPATIFAVDADGSNRTTLANAAASFNRSSQHPVWIPGTNSVVYTEIVGASHEVLYVVSGDGAKAPFFATTPANVTEQAEPAVTADGEWLYFSAFDSRCTAGQYCVSRARINGTSPELVIPTASRTPSPSPDGSKVAYGSSTTDVIRVFDVATQTASAWSVAGRWPAWSPNGSQIAYITTNGTVSFIAPDGTGARSLPSAGAIAMITGWSPDGKWLMGVTSFSPATSVLIDAATGVVLPRYSGIVSSMR